jgi:hypothetical protein
MPHGLNITNMKTIIIAFILLYGNFTYSQIHKQIDIPLLKETTEIDSLMEIVIQHTKSHNDYYCFTVMNIGYGYIFNVLCLNSKHLGVAYPLLKPKNMAFFGYFKFKNRIIFVIGEDDFSDFFSKSNTRASFKFTWNINNIDNEKIKRTHNQGLEYHNGKFVFESRNWRDQPEPIKN